MNDMADNSAHTYQWLETKNPKSRTWLKEENQRFERYLHSHRQLHRHVAGSLKQLADQPRTYTPSFDERYLYYWRFTPGQEQSVFYRQERSTGKEITAFDPRKFDPSNAASIASMASSPDGRLLAFSIAYNGGEDSILYMKDIDRDNLLLDTLPNAAKQFVWGDDNRTLFYVQSASDRFPHPTVWAHTVGSHPSTDRLVFDKKLDENQFIGLDASDNHRQIEIYVSRKFDFDDIYLLDASSRLVSEVTTGEDASTSIFVKDGWVYAKTNLDAPKYKLCRAPLKAKYPPLKRWETIVPEADDILEAINYSKDYIVLHYLHNAASKTIFATYEGRPHHELPLAPFSYLADMYSHSSSNEVYYEWQSFTEPATITFFDADTRASKQFFKEAAPSLGDQYVTEQHWFASRDGTRVPMFITRRKDGQGPAPTLLTGYGGFSTNMTPYYLGPHKPLIDEGFSFAVANIRGGGELGEKWHTDATGVNRQRSFDDFIAAAEFLQQQGLTTAEKLVIQGGSNGGLLVAACMVQRPELFSAVVCEVPLIDMLRFHLFANASSWIPEYGDPDNERDRAALAAYSPLEHIRADVTYPSLLVSTGDNDTRVSTHHAYKFVAKLRDVYGSDKSTILLRNDTAGGHSGGSGLSAWVRETADVMTFILTEMNVRKKD